MSGESGFPMVRERIARDPYEPRCKGGAAPLELPDMGKRAKKDVRCQVLGLRTGADAMDNERVDSVKVAFV
jgi:hypothetical protein